MDPIARIQKLQEEALARPQEQKDLEARSNDHRQSLKPSPRVKPMGNKTPRRIEKRPRKAVSRRMLADARGAELRHPKD